ncbi:MAG: hypothetical protein HY240_06955, partial [Actinobacteria bacterium]|nr:hypothetical protein [Actinomycetota bacterium]
MRARWGNPWLWLGVCAVFVVLGLFVFPKLFGFTFLFLPFVWMGRRGRAPDQPDRSNRPHHRAEPDRPDGPSGGMP